VFEYKEALIKQNRKKNNNKLFYFLLFNQVILVRAVNALRNKKKDVKEKIN
jgi:hypothetical protein